MLAERKLIPWVKAQGGTEESPNKAIGNSFFKKVKTQSTVNVLNSLPYPTFPLFARIIDKNSVNLQETVNFFCRLELKPINYSFLLCK